MKTTLLIVDGQNDFHAGGSLPVPNAEKDAERIASLIKSSLSEESSLEIDRIVATLDSHHKLHIAHPCFWVSKEGKHPDPFTLISSEDVKAGKWTPRKDLNLPKHLVYPKIMNLKTKDLQNENGRFDILKYCIEYTERLEKSGKFMLCIWPEHCLIGTVGHNIVPAIREAMDEWSDATGRNIEFVMKGQNLLTEMYSAFRAEVEISPETSLNEKLINSIKLSDRVLICGQALSHCVNHTARDLIDNFPGEEHKVEILGDCASPVPSFEEMGETFLQYIDEKGGKIIEDSKLIV